MNATCDVLVIGGGLSGAWAAVAAARAGAKVILTDKGYCGTSGVTAPAGPGHWWAPPEARADAIARKLAVSGGLASADWMARILEETWRTLPTLDGLYRFPRDENGAPRYRALRGPEYMRAMRTLVESHGVLIRDHAPALEFLLDRRGAVVGANGRDLRNHGGWSIRAGAVVLATGGYAFKSRLLGAYGNTGDGHLMAAEAGAELSGLEFSNFYSIAPARTTMTRTMSYAFARFFDAGGEEIDIPAGPDNARELGRALLKGPLFCSLDRMPEEVRRHLTRISPNVTLTFDRLGVDPFRDRFEVTLTAEGTVRGSGGVRVAGDDCRSTVEGLFVAGDLATRELVAGAVSGGGAVNSSWALSSGQWAGSAAALHALKSAGATEAVHPIGEAGLRPRRARKSLDPREIVKAAQAEILPYAKSLFRTGAASAAAAARLDAIWNDVRDGLVGAGDTLAPAREAAAVVATARWSQHAALARAETRGMHVRDDAPRLLERFAGSQIITGTDNILSSFPNAAKDNAA